MSSSNVITQLVIKLLASDAWKCRMIKQLVVCIESCHYWKYIKLFGIKGPKIIGSIFKSIVLKIPASFLFCVRAPQWAKAYSFTRFLDHTQRRTTVGRTPLDEWSALRRDLYLTTHDTHNRQIYMPPAWIRTHNLSRRVASDLRLRPRGHWDRLLSALDDNISTQVNDQM